MFGRNPLACQEFVELVTEYLDGVLPRRERRAFERHLALCDGCENYLQQMLATIRSAGELPSEPPDDDTRDRLLAAFCELRG